METLPTWATHLITLYVGLTIGSFLNVVIARLPHGGSVVYPRSRCPRCQTQIAWFDNVPVLSFLFLRGKCRQCKTPISILYPVVELLTALLFLVAKIHFGWGLALVLRDWPFMALLVAITFIDLEHRIIPDVLSLGGLVFGLLVSMVVPQLGIIQSLLGAVFGFGVFYSLAFVYQFLTGRSGLGGGDIKLLAMLGAFLGPSGVFATILISSVLGSLVGVIWALFARSKDAPEDVMKFSIPFGPFLVIGALYYDLFGDQLWLQFMIPT